MPSSIGWTRPPRLRGFSVLCLSLSPLSLSVSPVLLFLCCCRSGLIDDIASIEKSCNLFIRRKSPKEYFTVTPKISYICRCYLERCARGRLRRSNSPSGYWTEQLCKAVSTGGNKKGATFFSAPPLSVTELTPGLLAGSARSSTRRRVTATASANINGNWH